MTEQAEGVSSPAEVKHLNVRQAAFIGVGSMVGATFVFTTLIHEPASIVALVVILVLSVGLDLWWKGSRTGKAEQVQVAH